MAVFIATAVFVLQGRLGVVWLPFFLDRGVLDVIMGTIWREVEEEVCRTLKNSIFELGRGGRRVSE